MAILYNFPTQSKEIPTITTSDFTYTGTYQLSQDTEGWKIKFLTSGTFTPKKAMTIDIFVVGGGAGGGWYAQDYAGPGGGGGYVSTSVKKTLTANTAYRVVVGAGGTAATSSSTTGGGGNNSAFALDSTYLAITPNKPTGGNGSTHQGGNGGSGGAGQGITGYAAGSHDVGAAGGSDGHTARMGTNYYPGYGYGYSTREFGEAAGTLYAGGGGAGEYYYGG